MPKLKRLTFMEEAGEGLSTAYFTIKPNCVKSKTQRKDVINRWSRIASMMLLWLSWLRLMDDCVDKILTITNYNLFYYGINQVEYLKYVRDPMKTDR